MTYKPIHTAPTEPHNYFLVRVIGEHPRGGKYIPTVVQQINGELYSPDNELEPLIWVKRGTEPQFLGGDGTYQQATRVEEADLEWCELPE